MNREYNRVVITNLPNEKKYCEMIASVIGQLSDGIWENSRRCRGYWIFAECNSGNNNINVSNRWIDSYYQNKNPYYDMTDDEIRKYFAKKIKEITLIELEDNYKYEVGEKILGDLHRCMMIPNDRYDEYLEKYNEYKEYIENNPFVKKGKFTIDNETELCYLNYDETIKVSDAYKAYKILMK